MGNRFIAFFIFIVSNLAWSSPRITYADFLNMSPEKQKAVVKILMKSYSTFEEIQRRDGISLERKLKIKQSSYFFNLVLNQAYAQEIKDQSMYPALDALISEDKKKKQYRDLENKLNAEKQRKDKLNQEASQKLEKSLQEYKETQTKPQTPEPTPKYDYLEELIKDMKGTTISKPKTKTTKKRVSNNKETNQTTNNDPNRKCIYAGWYSTLNTGKNTCQHPSRGNNRYRSQIQELGLNDKDCQGTKEIICNPMIYGHTPDKKVICAGGNNDSENSSLACWNKANKLNEQHNGSILESVLKMAKQYPNKFADLLETVFNMCLCGQDDNINKDYAHRMQRHRTCYGILKQASDVSELVKSCTIEDGNLVLGGQNEDNITDFEYIHQNLTNFFDENGNLFEDFASDNTFKVGSKEWKKLNDLDDLYTQKWDSYRPDELKCDLLDDNKGNKVEVIAEDAKEPEVIFDHTIEIAFVKDDPYAKQAILKAIVKDKDGEIVKDLSAEGLQVVWYETKNLIDILKKEEKEKKEQKTEDQNQMEVEMPSDDPNATKVVEKEEIEKEDKYPGSHAKVDKSGQATFERGVIKSNDDVKGYPVRATLVKQSKRKISNQLVIKPVALPPQGQPNMGPRARRGKF